MSKRFGRNQKRKMKTEIEQLQEALVKEQNKYSIPLPEPEIIHIDTMRGSYTDGNMSITSVDIDMPRLCRRLNIDTKELLFARDTQGYINSIAESVGWELNKEISSRLRVYLVKLADSMNSNRRYG